MADQHYRIAQLLVRQRDVLEVADILRLVDQIGVEVAQSVQPRTGRRGDVCEQSLRFSQLVLVFRRAAETAQFQTACYPPFVKAQTLLHCEPQQQGQHATFVRRLYNHDGNLSPQNHSQIFGVRHRRLLAFALFIRPLDRVQSQLNPSLGPCRRE